jgi:hypothetical protein
MHEIYVVDDDTVGMEIHGVKKFHQKLHKNSIILKLN